MDKTTRRKILSYLYDIYRTSPYKIRDTKEIAEALGIPFNEAKSELMYLHQKGLVDTFYDDDGDVWAQKINADGIDELEKLEAEASAGIDHSLDVEVSQENFHGIMKVFISHKFDNKNHKLALILRNALRSQKIDGYLAETKREYELLIGDKIRGEIDTSDFVVGLITKESENSASVNQELGYALGRGVPVVIMVEKGVSHGVLTHGREPEEFTSLNFVQHCTNVVKYILEKGMSKRKSNRKNNSVDYDLVLDKFTESGIHHVGIRNARGKTIKSCTIICNYQKCAWWNTHDVFPRNIMEGEAANVILPRGFANTNPIIEIISGDQIIEQIFLSEIAHRPSTKWTAEDENKEQVERLNTALGRIRSNLASLRSNYDLFLIYQKDIPMTAQMKYGISEKDELVENIQTVVNQTSHILDMDWVQQLNDFCTLAKKNPELSEDKLQIKDVNGCHGIIIQLDILLKHLPNPMV